MDVNEEWKGFVKIKKYIFRGEQGGCERKFEELKFL